MTKAISLFVILTLAALCRVPAQAQTHERVTLIEKMLLVHRHMIVPDGEFPDLDLIRCNHKNAEDVGRVFSCLVECADVASEFQYIYDGRDIRVVTTAIMTRSSDKKKIEASVYPIGLFANWALQISSSLCFSSQSSQLCESDEADRRREQNRRYVYGHVRAVTEHLTPDESYRGVFPCDEVYWTELPENNSYLQTTITGNEAVMVAYIDLI